MALERLVIGPSARYGCEWTAGILAECLFFFNAVDLHIRYDDLVRLMRVIGKYNLLKLICDKRIKLYCEAGLRVTRGPGMHPAVREPGIVRLDSVIKHPPWRDKSAKPTERDHFRMALEAAGTAKYTAQRISRDYEPHLDYYKFHRGFPQGKNFWSLYQQECSSEDYMTANFHALASLSGLSRVHYEKSFFFAESVSDTLLDFRVHSDFDFDLAASHKDIGLLSPANFLFAMLDVAQDMFVSIREKSGVLCSQASQSIIKSRYLHSNADAGCIQDAVGDFQDKVFSGTRISEALDNGHRSYDEFVRLLDHKETLRFREWLQKIKDFEEGAVAEYLDSLRQRSVLDKGWGSVGKFILSEASSFAIDMTGVGRIGKALDWMKGGLEQFAVDAVLKGWSPQHFVQGRMAKFLDREHL